MDIDPDRLIRIGVQVICLRLLIPVDGVILPIKGGDALLTCRPSSGCGESPGRCDQSPTPAPQYFFGRTRLLRAHDLHTDTAHLLLPVIATILDELFLALNIRWGPGLLR